MRLFISALALVLFGCDSGKAPPPAAGPQAGPTTTPPTALGVTPTATLSGRVTPDQGGMIGELPNACIMVPPNSTDKEISVEIATLSGAPPESPGVHVLGPVYRVRVDGQDHFAFKEPVTVMLPYDPAQLKHPEHRAAIGLSVWDGRAWNRVPNSHVDVRQKAVLGQVDHFSDVANTEDLPTRPDGHARVTARWFAWVDYRRHDNYSSEPGGFGELLSGPNRDSQTTYGLAWREQIDLRTGVAKTVTDESTWESRVRNGTFRLKNGQILPGGPGGHGGGTIPPGSGTMKVHPQFEGGTFQLRTYFSDEAGYSVATNTLQHQGNPRDMKFEAGPQRATRRPPPTPTLPLVFDARPDPDGNYFLTNRKSGSRPMLNERLGGGNNWTWEAAVTKAVTPQVVRVKGRVLHRIHAAGPGDGFINPPTEETSRWAEIADKVIPAAGASVEMELVDAKTGQSVSGTLVHRVGEAGTFEQQFPYKDTYLLRVKSVWKNDEAQIREEGVTEVPFGLLTTERPYHEGRAAVKIQRSYKAWLRYAGAPNEFPLGQEERIVALRQGPDGPILEFTEMGSLLVGTFVYRARHANQNKSNVTIRSVPVPRQAIIDAFPRELPRDILDKALGRIPAGDLTEVSVRGSEVCFPSSTLMVLDALGLEEASDARVGDLAQSIYNIYPRPQPLPPAYTWSFPFRRSVGPNPSWNFGIPWLATYGMRWPYTEGTPGGPEKKWLITVEPGDGTSWRPWQTSAIVKPVMNRLYPGALDLQDPWMIDVFRGENHPRVLAELGRGAVGTVSIDHLSQPGSQRGTHVLALLGVVAAANGSIVRHVFHDPYGDLTQTPTEEGYYRPRDKPGDWPTDVDKEGHIGRYVPYGAGLPTVQAHQGTIAGNYWFVYRPAQQPSVAAIRARLLEGDP